MNCDEEDEDVAEISSRFRVGLLNLVYELLRRRGHKLHPVSRVTPSA